MNDELLNCLGVAETGRDARIVSRQIAAAAAKMAVHNPVFQVDFNSRSYGVARTADADQLDLRPGVWILSYRTRMIANDRNRFIAMADDDMDLSVVEEIAEGRAAAVVFSVKER